MVVTDAISRLGIFRCRAVAVTSTLTTSIFASLIRYKMKVSIPEGA
jgi:hypothetical protein